MAAVYLLLISFSLLTLLQWSNAFAPVVYPGKSLPSFQCGQSDPLQDQQLTNVRAIQYFRRSVKALQDQQLTDVSVSDAKVLVIISLNSVASRTLTG